MTVAGLLSMTETKPLKFVCADAVLKIASTNQYVPVAGPSIEIGFNTEHYNGLNCLVIQICTTKGLPIIKPGLP